MSASWCGLVLQANVTSEAYGMVGWLLNEVPHVIIKVLEILPVLFLGASSISSVKPIE